jgi:hypothetical protein
MRVRLVDGWKRLFEEALLEHDASRLADRLQIAENAIMDRMDHIAFDTASLPERRLLLAALRAIGELRRLFTPAQVRHLAGPFGHAA